MGRKYKENHPETEPQSVLQLVPKTATQDALITTIKHNPITLVIGPAGCGKTYISAAMAAKYYNSNYVDKIILSRANVPTGRTLGHFPGSIEDKLTPWMMPSLDVLRKFMGDGKFKYCMEKKTIQLQPIETIRGRSFDSSFIIVDEAQNLSIDEIISITTRLGEESKLILLGDPFQSDLRGESGLVWFDKIAAKYDLNIPSVHFTLDDVVRSRVVKEILVALYKEFEN